MNVQKLNIDIGGIEWLESENVSDYEACIKFMEDRAIAIRNNEANECVWFVEHTPLYTAGTSAQDNDLISNNFPVFKTGRGGQYTYHGTGQRTIYLMLDLQKRKLGIKEYVTQLEQWVIDTLAEFGIKGERRCGRVGIWVDNGNGTEDKVCAIGVRVKKWVSYFGIAFNINPDLSHYNGIIPCGISDNNFGVGSLEKLGINSNKKGVDDTFINTFNKNFPKP
ncbi:MAG: lipoyl(octanoyl) transferase LipB [Alphaproteobacteria bacterium]